MPKKLRKYNMNMMAGMMVHDDDNEHDDGEHDEDDEHNEHVHLLCIMHR